MERIRRSRDTPFKRDPRLAITRKGGGERVEREKGEEGLEAKQLMQMRG